MPKSGQATHSCVARVLGKLALGASTLAFAAAFAATPSLAQAQAAANTPSGGIETVTVTAQYVSQNIQSAPLAISVVTAQDLDQRGIVNLEQIGTTIPSLTLTPAPAAFGNDLQTYIRGVGQYDSAFASEPGVGMYIDDIYYGTMTGSQMSLLDLNRIEVLKGPQGVLGGKNDIGGAIKMFTQKPSDDNAGYLEGTYGSFNEISVKGATDLTVIPGHLFLRVSAMSKNQDGYVNIIDFACANPSEAGSLPVLSVKTNCKLGTEGGTNVKAGRLAARIVINPQLEDTLAVDIVRDNSELTPDVLYGVDAGTINNVGGKLVADGNDGNFYFNNGSGIQSVPRATYLGAQLTATSIPGWNIAYNIPKYGIPWDQRFIPNNPFKTTYATYTSAEGIQYTDGELYHSWSFSNILDYDIFSWLHFKLITGYRFYNSGYSNDSDVSPLSFQLTTTYTTNREFQQEERFTGTLFGDSLEWTAGAFTYYRENRATGPVILDADYFTGATFLVFEQNDTYVNKNTSGYVHLIYHLFDNVEIFGGARYTSESKTYYFDHSGNVPGYPFSGFFRATVDGSLDCNIFAGHLCDHSINPALIPHTSTTERPDWRAGVDYHVTDDAMAYFQFSTGYRTGGTNSRPFAPDQLNSYGPEEIKSYEIGAKTQWFDNRLRFNAALYDADYSHIITPLAETDTSLGFPLPEVLYRNLGEATNKGIELEATAAPIDNSLITANWSTLSSVTNPAPGHQPGFLDGCTTAAAAANICPQVAAGTARIGSAPILIPRSQFNISAQYTWNLPDSAGDLTPRLDFNWQGKIYQGANDNPYTMLPGRGILNARLTWDAPQGGWQVALAVYNVADKKYFYSLEDFAVFGEGTVEGNPAPPREWAITFKKSF